eukprot:9105153-Alexandrium_andersonii.AAC.1
MLCAEAWSGHDCSSGLDCKPCRASSAGLGEVPARRIADLTRRGIAAPASNCRAPALDCRAQ